MFGAIWPRQWWIHGIDTYEWYRSVWWQYSTTTNLTCSALTIPHRAISSNCYPTDDCQPVRLSHLVPPSCEETTALKYLPREILLWSPCFSSTIASLTDLRTTLSTYKLWHISTFIEIVFFSKSWLWSAICAVLHSFTLLPWSISISTHAKGSREFFQLIQTYIAHINNGQITGKMS